jgi:hypothetical protein
MIGYILCIGLGAVAASAVWFFVWRNNKQLLAEWMAKADEKVTEKINDWDPTE